MVCSMGTNQLCCGITCPQPEVDKFQPMNYQADVCSISCQNSNFFQDPLSILLQPDCFCSFC